MMALTSTIPHPSVILPLSMSIGSSASRMKVISCEGAIIALFVGAIFLWWISPQTREYLNSTVLSVTRRRCVHNWSFLTVIISSTKWAMQNHRVIIEYDYYTKYWDQCNRKPIRLNRSSLLSSSLSCFQFQKSLPCQSIELDNKGEMPMDLTTLILILSN